ncbi:pre-toxin TG domain-containing protein [Streptomyces sp. NPDC050485]|uniref:pre-toxin TG domain-containing protein n=1 Tax=Streptomyces sp. NPDC050485 TaxID=3365617 RepID=UPI00378EBDC9
MREEANKEYRQILLGTGKVIENTATLARGLIAVTELINAISDFITNPELHQAIADMNAGFEEMKSSLDTMNAGVKEINQGLDQMNRGVNKANSGLDRVNQGLDQSNKAMANLNKAVPEIAAGALKLRELPVLKDFDFSEALKDFNNGRSPLEDKVVQTKFGAILDLLPGIGDGKGIVQLITGQDMATGDRLGVTERLMGSVILLRWMKAGKSVIKVEEINKAIKAEKATGKI